MAWRSVASMVHKLRWALECQLERDSELSFIEYHTLARLSEEPRRRLRMSDLAVLTNASLSRLSHLIKRLESTGDVRREPDPTDGRYTTRSSPAPATRSSSPPRPRTLALSGNSSSTSSLPANSTSFTSCAIASPSTSMRPRGGSSSHSPRAGSHRADEFVVWLRDSSARDRDARATARSALEPSRTQERLNGELMGALYKSFRPAAHTTTSGRSQ